MPRIDFEPTPMLVSASGYAHLIAVRETSRLKPGVDRRRVKREFRKIYQRQLAASRAALAQMRKITAGG